jgi:hypothetical protein
MDKMRYCFLLIILCFLPFSAFAQKNNVGKALSYTLCNGPDESNACFIGFHKMSRLKNPLNGKLFFRDGIHYLDNGQLFMYPTFAVAQPDLDGDGFKELIVVPHDQEKTVGTFCKELGLCPHFVLQDRNIEGEKPSLRNFKVLGAVYSYGVGLSTDEVVGGYRSLRAYTDPQIKNFDVFQYDRKSDQYFNISNANGGAR